MERNIPRVMDNFQSFLSDKREGYILLERGNVSSFDLPHFLPVKLHQNGENQDLQASTLWLDAGNSFDPYEISEISRYLDVEPKKVLGDIFVSRAFTGYQISSLVIEKMDNALDKHRPDLIVITGLSSAFLRSSMSSHEAKKVLESIFHKLKEFESRREDVILTLRNHQRLGEDFVLSKLVKLADIILKVEGEGKNLDLECEKGFSGWSKLFSSSFPNDNSSSDFVKLDDYVGD